MEKEIEQEFDTAPYTGKTVWVDGQGWSCDGCRTKMAGPKDHVEEERYGRRGVLRTYYYTCPSCGNKYTH